ncbi:MAG: hypothetical protein NDJ89_18855 [Oligoflexia bacterium]|nr:hypothetical protein [Oligoflexia bacterium]
MKTGLNRIGLALGLALGLGLSATQAMANGAWGGGDLLRRRFADGREYAIQIVQGVAQSPFQETRAELRDWISAHHAELVTDLAQSMQVWTEASQGTCARTQYRAAAPIVLSFQTCYRTSSTEDAAWLLIHESVHHFNIVDEVFADEIAGAIMKEWKAAMLKEMPICKNQNNVVANGLLGSWEAEMDLAMRMNPEAAAKIDYAELSFVEDSSAAKLFTGMGQCAFLAGHLELRMRLREGEGFTTKIERSPFVLVEHNGTTVLVFDEDLGARPGRIDYHPSYLQLARANEAKDDLLFFGGDHGWEPHFPFRRKR